MVRLNPKFPALQPKPEAILECDRCKAEIFEKQVYACISLTFESMDPITAKDLTPEYYEGQNRYNEKLKVLGEPELEPSEHVVDVRHAEQLAAFCMTCAEKMGLTRPNPAKLLTIAERIRGIG